MSTAAPIHAVVYAKDLAALARFYEDVLGLARLEESQGFVLLGGQGYELSVVAMPSEAAERLVLQDPPIPLEDTPIKLSFLVPGIEERRQAVAGAGGSLSAHEAAWSWRGQLHLDGVDPEGNVFQLRQVQR